MTYPRKLALATGIFFVITIIASIPAAFIFYAPVLNNSDYIIGAGADTRVVWGAFLEVITALACIGTAVALFPIVKKQNEAVALGYVAVRVLEAALIGNGLLLGYLMYRSGLVPRRLALLGLVGGPLVTASGVAILFGLYEQVSPVAAITAIPETLWEASLGIWLIVKGFNPSVSASEKFRLSSDAHSPETQGVTPVPAP